MSLNGERSLEYRFDSMSPWLLIAVSIGVIYGGGAVFQIVFRMIDRVHERQRAAQASPREGAQLSRERGL